MNAEIRFIAAPLGSRDNPAPVILLFLSRLALPGICCCRHFIRLGSFATQKMQCPHLLRQNVPASKS